MVRGMTIAGGLLGLLAVTLAGCGGSSLPTVPVTGKVLVDGQPMEGVSVVFNPVDASGRAASGVTDAEGKFTLTTEVNGDGALPGSYKVAISKYLVADDNLPEEVNPDDEASMDAIYGSLDTSKEQANKPLIDPMYSDPNGSGLTAEVKKDGENYFEFEVKGAK
ncbi:MAG: hypothetical protein D6753_12765 [Planctomycetota bacterium]|nr:MAG: hypothetical protein D6753_12765 [Planctomycetota bacterium]